MEENDDAEQFHKKLQAADLTNLRGAMNELINPVSRFISTTSLEDLTPQDFLDALNALEFATFMVSGVMYSYGMNICEHEDHEQSDDEVE